MLNPIFWKKVQGQKHPGRWGIVDHQIHSIKVLFKTNAKSHKHPGIKLLSSESKTQLVNQRKQNSYRRAYIYIYIWIYILTQSFWTGTKVIRRKHIIQPTGFGACSSTCCLNGCEQYGIEITSGDNRTFQLMVQSFWRYCSFTCITITRSSGPFYWRFTKLPAHFIEDLPNFVICLSGTKIYKQNDLSLWWRKFQWL